MICTLTMHFVFKFTADESYKSTQLIDWLVVGGTHCRNNIVKQLLKSQLDITWNWFPSTPRGVQNLACQKIEHCTKQMNRTNVCNAFDHGRLDAQTSQAGFVQQQCYCKDIQLMKRSESRKGWIIELGVTIQLEHRQGRCLSCESVMDSNDFSP